jgi:hypothetical protein
MDDKEIALHKAVIDNMTRYEMAKPWRFAPSGHIYFDSTLPFFEHFKKRFFQELGGFTPEISKSIGWGD